MYTFNRLLSILGAFAILFLIFAAHVLFGIYIISLLIVPLTWIWAKLTDQNYYALIDTSNMLYKLNIIGQWSWLFTAAFMITILIFGKLTLTTF